MVCDRTPGEKSIVCRTALALRTWNTTEPGAKLKKIFTFCAIGVQFSRSLNKSRFRISHIIGTHL